MKLVTLSLVLSICYLSSVYAMETPQEILLRANASVKEAKDILDGTQRHLQVAFFTSIEAAKKYTTGENVKALSKINEAISLAQSVKDDKIVTAEIKKSAQNSLDRANQIMQEIIN